MSAAPKMRAWQLPAGCTSVAQLELVDLPRPDPGPGEVLVRVRANSLNYRDQAIAVGRWTPSPQERQRIAAAFGVSIDEISWGHNMDPRNIRYHRFGLKENF